jgi:ATP-dependent DNA helicase 2 subunit 2
MALTDTYSPVLHRIDQAIRWRAVHPKEPIPPAPEILVKFSRTPEELQSLAQADLKKLIAAAAIEKGTSKSPFPLLFFFLFTFFRF